MARAISTTSRVDEDLFQRANRAIASGALTNSKRPETFVKGVYPTHFSKALGAFTWDTRGNKYLDFVCGLGTAYLGHANERLVQAAFKASQQGVLLSLGSEQEVECAERLKEFFPFTEKWRFLHGGSQAVHAALRIARGATGKHKILSEGYHGWHDEFVSLTPPAVGCVSSSYIESLPADWRDIETKDVAAIIVEPVITDCSDERYHDLRWLRDFCTRNGIYLIFDEIITGIRFENHSVAKTIGVDPDLICLGKALGGGWDLSAVGGKQSAMESCEYFVSATHAGQRDSLAAAIETLKLLKDKVFDASLLQVKGRQFIAEFNQLSDGSVQLVGYPTRGVFKFRDELTKHLFFQECCLAGVFVGPSWFFSFAHIEHIDLALSVFKDVLLKIKMGLVEPMGEPPKSPFAQRMREKKES